jgi:TetR/AcrR family transcriptional repressor of nem operon
VTDLLQTERRQAILEVALVLIQRSGYNGFSYRDIADAVGIKAPSIHHHFPTKADLVSAVIADYRVNMLRRLDQIADETPDGPGRLLNYVDLFQEPLRDNLYCPGGMLSAERLALPKKVDREVTRFFTENIKWLSGVIASGVESGELRFDGDANEAAAYVMGGLEGLLLIAPALGQPDRFRQLAVRLVGQLNAAPRDRRSRKQT